MPPSDQKPPCATDATDNATDTTVFCTPCGPVIKRGRPSVAEAERISGKILDASWEVLLAEGFENFTFDRVARHAHIGKATIYSRFANKYDLMYALLWHRINLRRSFIMAQGADLPMIEAFCLRASEVLTMLASPDGVLIERLIDWLDQEKGPSSQPRVRAAAYRDAVDSIAVSFRQANQRGEATITDVEQASRFWIEGVLGHSRLQDAQGPTPREENEHWARDFSRYFFAGLAALQQR